jgi:hypothetical protein
MMRPNARKAVVQFLKGGTASQEELKKLAESEYAASVKMCRKVCLCCVSACAELFSDFPLVVCCFRWYVVSGGRL